MMPESTCRTSRSHAAPAENASLSPILVIARQVFGISRHRLVSASLSHWMVRPVLNTPTLEGTERFTVKHLQCFGRSPKT